MWVAENPALTLTKSQILHHSTGPYLLRGQVVMVWVMRCVGLILLMKLVLELSCKSSFKKKMCIFSCRHEVSDMSRQHMRLETGLNLAEYPLSFWLRWESCQHWGGCSCKKQVTFISTFDKHVFLECICDRGKRRVCFLTSMNEQACHVHTHYLIALWLFDCNRWLMGYQTP